MFERCNDVAFSIVSAFGHSRDRTKERFRRRQDRTLRLLSGSICNLLFLIVSCCAAAPAIHSMISLIALLMVLRSTAERDERREGSSCRGRFKLWNVARPRLECR